MDIIEIIQTSKTPSLTLNNVGAINIKGRLFGINSMHLFDDVIEFLKDTSKFGKELNITIELEYIDQEGKFYLGRLFKLIHDLNISTSVKWIYEEDDFIIQNLGEDLQRNNKFVNFQLEETICDFVM